MPEGHEDAAVERLAVDGELLVQSAEVLVDLGRASSGDRDRRGEQPSTKRAERTRLILKEMPGG
jgi:hypothetical protein